MKIHCSMTTKECMEEYTQYSFEERGTVEVKVGNVDVKLGTVDVEMGTVREMMHTSMS